MMVIYRETTVLTLYSQMYSHVLISLKLCLSLSHLL